MDNKTFYNEILTDHNLHPMHKETLDGATLVHEGINPSCGDDIWLQLTLDDNGVITDGAFKGDGCAISQASSDMMLDLVIGKTKEEALAYVDKFLAMIKGEASEADIDDLEEAGSLQDIAHMPSRVKCAVLAWHTLKEMIENGENGELPPSTLE